MKLVIDIPEEDYKSACKREFSMDGSMMIYNAIREGTEYKERSHGELTKESAIDYLTEIGWLPEHDRILTDRPHGAWVESKERKGHFYCSECVQEDELGKWREIFDYKYNFCPNCGADMRKGGE